MLHMVFFMQKNGVITLIASLFAMVFNTKKQLRGFSPAMGCEVGHDERWVGVAVLG
jgi:hypothetical protein